MQLERRFPLSVPQAGGWLAALFGVCGCLSAAPAWKEIYDPLVVRTLHLQVDPADWDRVRFDQPIEGQTESQQRAAAWFHGDGETPIQVEIRRKGQTDPALPSDADPRKVSLKIDINALVPGQEWHGLRKLSLENGGDSGPLHEGFAWQVHRLAAEGGCYRYDAANAAWVKLYLNGSYLGVYVSTEQRDEQMLRNRDLYSPYHTWLYKIDGGVFLEVGTGDSPTHTHLNFPPFSSKPGGGKPGSGGTAPDLDIDLPQWIDMESMLTLAVCEAFVENSDGLFTHSGKNSFAADFEPPNQRRRLYFPWDMDASIKTGTSAIYGTEAYQTQILGHAWFGRVYEHIFRELLADKLAVASLHGFLNQLEPVLAPVLDSDPYAAPSGGGAAAFGSLRNWVTTRVASVSSKLLLPHVARPSFNHPGGEVVPGFELTMSTPAGQVYFTTNGTDPRLPGGAVSPAAVLYSAPLVIDRATRVVARARNGTNWSGLPREAYFQVAANTTTLRITEIMYHPLDPDPGDLVDKEAYEFIEIHNTGAAAFDLTGYSLDGITCTFPSGTSIPAGARWVLVRNSTAFAARYPGVTWHGIYLGSLSNSGEKIRLRRPDGTTVLSVEYDDDPPWELSPDGMGYSLVNRNPEGNPDDAANWRASASPGGSPGAADPEPAHASGIVIHEVLSHGVAPFEDAVELHNPGAVTADLGGWFLSDEARTVAGDLSAALLKKFRLLPGTTVPAGGFTVLYEDAFAAGNPLVPFVLSPHGSRVYLSSADAAGNLTGTVVAIEFPATDPNVSYGRVSTSVGPAEALLVTPTFGVASPAGVVDFRGGGGAANAAARVGPVVISEVMYNPLPGSSEFVELHNVSASTVDISGWDIDGIDGFAFPPGTLLPGRGFVVLVDIATTIVDDFRARFAVPAATQVFGLAFDLGNAGEALRLEKPNPVTGQPDILVERLRYNDKAPWPTEADGAGPSLERLPPTNSAIEPLHWLAATMHGTPGRLGTAVTGLAIAEGSSWDAMASAAGLGTVWKEPAYNATAWSSVAGPAGYGEPFVVGVLSHGPDPLTKYPATYFRKPFVVRDDPANIASLTISAFYDDGFVVWLNGTEVARRCLPAGTIAYETLATEDREAGPREMIDLTPYKHLLTQGTNLLAVEVHQVSPASADLVWDASLTYTLATNPDDADGDGLPREWELANGLDDGDPADALLDHDGDGRNNTVEFLAGTNPRDGASFFKIDSAERTAAGGLLLRWASLPGTVYQVEYSHDLVRWFSFGPAGTITATGTVTEFSDPGNPLPASRCYRIAIRP